MAQNASQYTNISSSRPLFSRPLNEKILFVQILVGFFFYVNCLMICTFFKKEAFRSDTRYVLFVQTLFMDSALMLLSDVTLVWNYFQYQIHSVICIIICMTLSWLNLGTPLTLMAMCLERYVAICMPLRHAEISTTRVRLLGLILVWCSAAVPALVSLFMLVSAVSVRFYSSYLVCNINSLLIRHWHEHVRAGLCGFYFLAITAIIAFTYVKITRAARVASSGDKKATSKSLRTVVLHSFQLLLCQIQFVCPYIELAVMPIDFTLFINVRYSNFIVFILASRCLSPLIYGLRDQKFFLVLRYTVAFGLTKERLCRLCPHHHPKDEKREGK